MRKTWKTPENLRLRRIEEWRKARFDRMKNDPDIAKNDPDRAKAIRAAHLYTAVALRGDALAMGGAVTTYRECD